ncbi:MAG: MFS transporter [Kordiimonadaceae bacterium]|nr:MFS transporter [Kordiimonadaceae bacterium]
MFKIILSITALLLSIVILQFANSVVAPTVVLNANSSGSSLGSVGMIPTVYGLGFVLGCFWARKLLMNIGHIRSFTFAAALLASLTLMMHLMQDATVWTIFRGIMGCAIAIIMTCVDSWVGHVTPLEIRGRIMGFYSTITKLAYVGAPALLSYSAGFSDNAIIFCVLLFIISLIPICLTKLPQPEIGPGVTTSFKRILNDAPSAFIAAFILGFTNSAVLNMMPVYGVEVGLIKSQALILLVAAHFGGLLLQWPSGFMSDILGRRKIMIIGFSVSACMSIAMTFPFAANQVNALLICFIWGGAALSLYSIALSHAIDHVSHNETVAVCATILTTWSIGSIFGPVVAGNLMQFSGAKALFLFCGGFHALVAAFIIVRVIITAKRVSKEGTLPPEEMENLVWPQNRPL